MTLKTFQETIVSGTGVLIPNETGIPFDLPPFQMTFDLGIEEAVQEVVGPTAGLFDDQKPCKSIPGIDVKLAIGIDAPVCDKS